MTIATVLRSGGTYGLTWVWALKRAAARYLPGARFVCLSDIGEGPCFRRLRHDWRGWWAKMELGRSDLFEPGELVFYTDLDSLLTGDLSALAGYSGDFCTLRDFYTPSIAASGAMLFRAGGPTGEIYRAAAAAETFPPPRHGRSDPWWNSVVMPDAYLQDEYPGTFGSFKAHELDDGPGEFRHVSFHGQPKMTDFPRGHWVRDAWDDLSREVA